MTPSQQIKFVSLSLRIGLAAVFAYAGFDAIREPNAWIGFLPAIAFKLAPQKFVLDSFSISQLILAAALLWRRTSFLAAFASALILTGIIINTLFTDIGSLLITFRDIGLIFASLALIIVECPASFIKKAPRK